MPKAKDKTIKRKWNRIVDTSSSDEEVEAEPKRGKRSNNEQFTSLISKLQEIQKEIVNEFHSSSDSLDEDSNEGPNCVTTHNLSEILGLYPDLNEPSGTAFHDEVAIRWNSFLTKGLTKDILEPLIKKYPTAENCRSLKAPQLNKEVGLCLPREGTKQEIFLVYVQTILGAGLSAIGSVMSEIIVNPDEINSEKILATLADSGQLLCNVFHGLSEHRRYLVKPHMTEESRKILGECPIDEFLFGKNLTESFKTNEAITKLGKSLKFKKWTSFPRNMSKPGTSGSQTISRNKEYLNYKRPQNTVRKRPYLPENRERQQFRKDRGRRR